MFSTLSLKQRERSISYNSLPHPQLILANGKMLWNKLDLCVHILAQSCQNFICLKKNHYVYRLNVVLKVSAFKEVIYQGQMTESNI